MKFVRDVLLLLYWGPFKAFVQSLPAGRMYALAGLLTWLKLRLRPGHKAMLGDCALKMFPNISKSQVDLFVKKAVFQHWCHELEVMTYPKMNAAWVAENLALHGQPLLDAALAKGKGVMLVFGHFGANLMVMPALGYRGYKISQLSAPATVLKEKLPGDKSRISEWALDMRWEHEASLPAEHINIFGTLKPAFKCLYDGNILGLAVDGGGGSGRVGVPFLNKTAYFSVGGLSLALRTGCTVLPAFVLRADNGKNTLQICDPLPLPDGPDKQENLHALLVNFVSVFQRFVLEHPEHYLNFLAFREFMTKHGDPPYICGN